MTLEDQGGVGLIMDKFWKGRNRIGCSLEPSGKIQAQGPYGESAEALIKVGVQPQPPIARGTDFAKALQSRGLSRP